MNFQTMFVLCIYGFNPEYEPQYVLGKIVE